MSAVGQNFEEKLEQQVAEIDPATQQYLLQSLAENPPAVRKIVHNVLDEPIPQEMEKRLHKPLLSKTFQPRAPPCQRRARRRQELLREFDPFPPQNIRTVTDYQNEILDLYDEAKHEGVETEKGRRFIRWRFIKGLEENLTPNFMENIRENVHTASYIRHVYSYQLRNIEDDTVIVYYTNHGSPWINDLSAAGKWLSEQDTKRLNSDNTKRPSTKWEFVSFFNVDVKVVFDRQPLLGTGSLSYWLRKLAHGRLMVTLDTYQDNLCLWPCIAVHHGMRVDRSTTAARGLAKSFFKLKTVPTNSPKTSLDELDKIEKHLNQGTAFSDWLGIRVYEPEKVEDAEVVWHLRRNPPAQLKNIITIGIFFFWGGGGVGMRLLSRILKSLRKLMHAPIAKRDSPKLAIFNVIPKLAAKEKR